METSYQIVEINNGEKREFYARMIGGRVQHFADTIDEAIKLRDQHREWLSERDELSTAEIVKVDEDGNRLEIVY